MSAPVTIGRATLYLGDMATILPNIGTVDHIITDPPYSERTHQRHDENSQKRRDNADAKALGYSALSEADVDALAALLGAHSAGWVAWLTDSELAPHIRKAFDELVRLAGDGPCSWTDWIVVARTKALKTWGTLPGGYIAGEGWNDKERMGGKPTRLMRLMVTHYSRPDELVCDPFMGAGTTGVACMQEGRRFVGVEIDPTAFDIACKRIEDAQSVRATFSWRPHELVPQLALPQKAYGCVPQVAAHGRGSPR
jgi:site-specific DNA-methyltransferase (adenine-specific)